MGGTALTPMQYKESTHICFDDIDASSPEAHAWRRDKKIIISKAWIKQCYDNKMLPCNDDVSDKPITSKYCFEYILSMNSITYVKMSDRICLNMELWKPRLKHAAAVHAK